MFYNRIPPVIFFRLLKIKVSFCYGFKYCHFINQQWKRPEITSSNDAITLIERQTGSRSTAGDAGHRSNHFEKALTKPWSYLRTIRNIMQKINSILSAIFSFFHFPFRFCFWIDHLNFLNVPFFPSSESDV